MLHVFRRYAKGPQFLAYIVQNQMVLHIRWRNRMPFEPTDPLPQTPPSKEQQDALRLVLMYYEDKSKAIIQDIKSRADDIIVRQNVVDYVPTEPSEKHRAIFYGRKSVTRNVLEKNYAIYRHALGERLLSRRDPVSSLLKPAMQTIGLAPEESFIDRQFVEASFHQRARDEAEARATARRVVLEHEGFWLLYRLSTSHGIGRTPAADIQDRLINLSLLRVHNFAYLVQADHLSPRFTFEFRGDEPAGMTASVRRAQGYLVPLGEHLFLIGRRASRSMPTITALSWAMPDFELQAPVQHGNRLDGLAYAANAEGRQVAFYFVAKFIKESANLGFGSAFPRVHEIYQQLIRAYRYSDLSPEVINAYQAARHACQEKGITFQSAESPPLLTETELRNLVSRSENDVVFREGS